VAHPVFRKDAPDFWELLGRDVSSLKHLLNGRERSLWEVGILHDHPGLSQPLIQSHILQHALFVLIQLPHELSQSDIPDDIVEPVSHNKPTLSFNG
jgi:hypothetical protein